MVIYIYIYTHTHTHTHTHTYIYIYLYKHVVNIVCLIIILQRLNMNEGNILNLWSMILYIIVKIIVFILF
jgi:hypothetical protein